MDEFDPRAIFLIVFLVIGAIRWLLENGLKKKNPDQSHREFDYEERADTVGPRRSTLEDLYEEARREIQERQSQPSPPPTPIPTSVPAPPPLPPRARPVPKADPTPVVLPTVKKPQLSAEEQAALERFQQISSRRSPSSRQSRHQSRVRELLSSPSSARDAIVLAEILGPPKGTERERYARPTA